MPFLFERKAAVRAADALCATSTSGARSLWSHEPPRRLYRYRLGMTPQLDRLLFSGGDARHAGGAYLRASSSASAAWFKDARAATARGPIPLTLDGECGIELFLTAHGAGALSFSFALAPDLELTTALHAIHHLSLLTRPGEQAPWIHVGEPAEGHDHAAALGARLGRPGARFGLAELIAMLVEPLRGFGVAPIQEALSSYVVARMREPVDLGAPSVRAWAGPALAAFAQAEEAPTAPPRRDRLGVPNLHLEVNHWAAASLQGAAHLLSAPDGPEAQLRTQRAHDRFFVPYLTALLQRCAIKKAAEEATEIDATGEGARERVSALRSHVLEFALSGALPEVSVRASLHRYYRMCQRAVDLQRNMGQVRRALGDLEAQLAARQQMEIAEGQRQMAHRTAEALESSHKIHVALEWIEVFIVVAYAAELVKFFVLELPHIEHLTIRWGAALLALVPGVIALAVLRPWRHRHDAQAHPAHSPKPAKPASPRVHPSAG